MTSASGTKAAGEKRVADAPNPYVTAAVRSREGTEIGYRRYGNGPAIVLVQAAAGTVQSYHELASDLARDFTVYVPERRGRPLSPASWTPTQGIEQEIEDLSALFERSGDCILFGLSSGAVIALEAARRLPSVTGLVVYEPPFYVPPHRMNFSLVERYRREVDQDDIAGAMVSALLAAGVAPAIVRVAPRWIMEAIVSLALRLDDRRTTRVYPPLRELVPSIRFDFGVVRAMQDRMETFASIRSFTMVLSGGRSPAFLRDGCAALHQILPHSRHVEFERLGHSGPWNADRGGNPATVASAIRAFVANPDNH